MMACTVIAFLRVAVRPTRVRVGAAKSGYPSHAARPVKPQAAPRGLPVPPPDAPRDLR